MENKKYEDRPWGFFEVLHEQYGKVKVIHVYPKKRLSYQMHYKRNEVWTVMQGTGVATVNDKVQEIKPGSVVLIPAECKHRIENTNDLIPLVFIEVQYGAYHGEDDIVRFEDDYGRI